MTYAAAIKQVSYDEFYKLSGDANPRLIKAWTQAKFKRITKLMRYAHRGEGVWS